MIAKKIFNVQYTSIGDSVKDIEKKTFNNDTILIKNWVDETYFRKPTLEERSNSREFFDIQETEITIISVGTCNDKKNHTAIIEALAILKKRGSILRYLHRGTGPTLAQEKEFAIKKGVFPQITFLDYLDDVRLAYWAADIFVMTSEYEGLSIASLEAMFCGLPLLVYDTYGLRDVIIDSYNGILLKNLNNLNKKILEVYNSSELRKTFSENSIKLAKEKFSMEKSVKEIIELYKINS